MRLGRKHIELAAKWVPSAMTYGATAGLGVIYLTDWKIVAQYIPYYGGKFSE